MHYITLINRTAANIDGSAYWFDRLFELEVLLIIWSYIECGSMLYMLYRTTQYHPNLTCLLKHLVIQYFFSMAARLIQIVKMYGADEQEVIPVWYHLASFIFANIASFIICLANDRCNQKQFTSLALMGKRSTEYSLSQRFQLVENLKTAHLFKRGISFIILFSVSCSSFISAEVIENDPILKNWMHVGFNYTAIIYGIGLPAAMYYYNEQWQMELKRLFYEARKTICRRNITVDVEDCQKVTATKTLRNTKGVDMMPRKENETDIYFSQLNKEWNYVRKISDGQQV